MGTDQSKQQRPPSRSTILPSPHAQQNAADAKPQPSPSARPVDVPRSSLPGTQTKQFYPSGQPDSGLPCGLPTSKLCRPPRLPLPIEEVYGPGSPIITLQDISLPIGKNDVYGLARRASVLSSTTVDDEDVGDNEAFLEDPATIVPSVPTPIEWNGPGEMVYVTGTFVQWDRKFKLHRDKKIGFSTMLQLKPGTHHLKFLVDGDMMVSNDLPTTVDYTNILVNYIEIVAPLSATVDMQPSAPAKSAPLPGAVMPEGHAPGAAEPVARSLETRTEMRAPGTEADIALTQETMPAPEVSKPLSLPSTQTSRTSFPAQQQQSQQGQEQELQKPPRQPLRRGIYTKQIPHFLLDLSRYSNPEDERFQRSARIINTLPQPPSLPIFLGKSILDGTTPHKDDASVLITPNHTVLNHLATSSIKNGVLATSGTTRYKRKVCLSELPKQT